MITRFRSWWQNIRKPLEVAIIFFLLVVLIALIVVIILGYKLNWGWTGLGKKTLWDWMQLLIIPSALAIGAYLFNFSISRNEQKIASDKQREDALQAYFDRMSELLFEKNLRESKSDSEVRTMARARTLTVLHALDAERKGNLLQFLYEARLINIDVSDGIIDLSKVDLTRANLTEANLRYAIFYDADLRGANLGGADLEGAIFYDAYLHGANLSNTDLSFANLTGADLTGADLTGADLSGANLFSAIITTEQLDTATSLKGTIMPDGSKHP
jgi:uncharacterized protein YjbI with pentapeptide repeats